AATLVQEKIVKLSEFPAFAGFLFHDVEADVDGGRDVVAAARDALAELEPFTADAIETSLREVLEQLGLKPRQGFQPIRIAVTGSKVSPGLFESIELLGRETTLARLSAASSAAEASAEPAGPAHVGTRARRVAEIASTATA